MHVAATSQEHAEQIRDTHKCPYAGGETRWSWDVTKTLVEQIWDKLDAEMVKIKSAPTSSAEQVDVLQATQRARAFAEVLAIFMVPHFRTADDIAREAAKRYKAKQAGEDYETPGLGSRRYETAANVPRSAAPGWHPAPDGGYTSDPAQAGYARRGGRTATRTATKPEVKLGEKEQTAIKFAHESGMFKVADLAKTYGVSEAVINQIIGA